MYGALAQPGWRLVVLGPDEDVALCPVVAWSAEEDDLVPYARTHPQDGFAILKWAGDQERVVGLLAPGEEYGPGWDEAASQLAEALREAEDGS